MLHDAVLFGVVPIVYEFEGTSLEFLLNQLDTCLRGRTARCTHGTHIRVTCVCTHAQTLLGRDPGFGEGGFVMGLWDVSPPVGPGAKPQWGIWNLERWRFVREFWG